MSSQQSPPTPLPVTAYIKDGARIGAILVIWGTISAFFTYGVSEIGGTGSLFETIGPGIGGIVAITGLLNAILYICYRAIDYWRV